MAKKRKKTAPQPAAKSPSLPENQPPKTDTDSKTAMWMGAMCYLSILIIIPAMSRWRQDDFVKFHLNQGLVILALATVCGAIAMVPGAGELGVSMTLIVDFFSLMGLVEALRRRKTALPLLRQITRNFHPFE